MSGKLTNNAHLDIWNRNSFRRHCPEFFLEGLNKTTLYLSSDGHCSCQDTNPSPNLSDLKELVRIREILTFGVGGFYLLPRAPLSPPCTLCSPPQPSGMLPFVSDLYQTKQTPVVIVMYCQVEISATSWSLVQRSPTECGVSLCVIKNPQKWGGHGPRWAAAPKKTNADIQCFFHILKA